MKNLFIINPAAGGRKHEVAKTEKMISDLMETLNEPYEIYITTAPMDACEKVETEAKTNLELRVYACGGDGTLNEVLSGCHGMSEAEIAHYPVGSGNDYIKNFADPDAFRQSF